MKNLLANPTYLAAKAFGFAYLGFALYLSFTHQIALFAGLGSENPWVAPILTDTLMVFGKMLRSHKLAKGTRIVGLVLQMFGATLSMTANIFAGTNAGDRIIGAMVITLMLVIEFVTDHTKPVEQDAKATKKATTAAAVAKAQATRAANQAATAKAAAEKAAKDAARKERAAMTRRIKAAEKRAAAEQAAKAAEVPADLDKWAADQAAPVSPAPWTYI